jgi:integrase
VGNIKYPGGVAEGRLAAASSAVVKAAVVTPAAVKAAAVGSAALGFSLAVLAVAGNTATPVAAQAIVGLNVVAVDASHYPTVNIDLALPQAVAAGAPQAAAFSITGATIHSAGRLDPRQLTVGVVVDDAQAVPAASLITEQGSAVELVRNLDVGTSVVVGATSGVRSGPTTNRAAAIAAIAKIGAAPAQDRTAFGRTLSAVAVQLVSSASRRGALVVLADSSAVLGTADARALSATLTRTGVPLRVVVVGTRLDPGLASVAKSSSGGAVAVARAAYLGRVDAVTRTLTGQYRVTATVAKAGPHALRLTVAGHTYGAELNVPGPPTTTSPTSTVPTSVAETTAPQTVPATSSASAAPLPVGSSGVGRVTVGAGKPAKKVAFALVAIGLIGMVGATVFLVRRRSQSRPTAQGVAEPAEAFESAEPAEAFESAEPADVADDLVDDFADDLSDDLDIDEQPFPEEELAPMDFEGDGITLAEWFEGWWPSVTNVRPAARARDERYARDHFLRVFGDVPLEELDRVSLQSWASSLTDPDGAALTAPAVHRTVQTLDRCLDAAVDDDLLFVNPAANLQLPKIEPQPMRLLSDDQLWRLVEAIDPHFRAFVLLGGFCGLRLAELLALRWANVDLERHRVEIAEALLEGEGQLRIGRPKTKAAVRSVPLPAFVRDELTRLAEAGHDTDTLVFCAPDGHLLRPTVFRRSFWLPAVERAGLGSLGIHDLRSTAVSMWIAEGAHPEQVAALAGHTSASVVMELYGDLFRSQDDRLIAALERRASPHLGART